MRANPSRTYLFILLLSFSCNCFSQDSKHVYIHSLSNAVGFSLEGGITYSSTDFNSNKYDYLGRGMIEYFFYSNNIGTFGLRIHGGLTYVGGKGGVSITDENYSSISELKTAVYHIGGGYSYTIALGEIVHPYLFAGLSYIKFFPRGNNNLRIANLSERKFSENEINYNGEVGVRFLMHDNFSLNISSMVHFNPSDNLDGVWANDNDDIFYSGNIGLSYYFLHAKDSDADGVDDSEDFCPNTPPFLNVDNFGCPLDSDNDGVPDQLDICPETQIGVVVDSNGCPLDIDEDGITDNLDQCLYTPPGVEVDSVGCPIDLDADGIPDYLDHCPQTPIGYLVDSLGCPDIIYDNTYNKIILANFEFASNQIPISAFSVLEEVIKYASRHPELTWSIEGHSDSVSVDCDNNYALSLQRAKSVQKYFLTKGINKGRLTTIGFSHFNPIASNASKKGRGLNRRVEIIKIR